MESPDPPLKEVKAYLNAAGVDFSDCFERCELIERFRAVRIKSERTVVERMKAKANAAFRRHSLEYAVRQYTDAALAACALHDAAEARHFIVLLLANRSQALLMLQLPARALRDAQNCVRLEPSYVKGHARLAAACLALGRLRRGIVHLNLALECSADAPEQQASLKAQRDEALAKLGQSLPGTVDTAAPTGTAVPSNASVLDRVEAAAVAKAAVRAAGAELIAAEGGADSVDAAEAAEKSEAMAREAGVQEECPLLHTLGDDLLATIVCYLHEEAELVRAAATCRALRRAVAGAVAEGGCWHAVCASRYPTLSADLCARDEKLRSEGKAAMGGSLPGEGEGGGERTLALDWHVLLRERIRHRSRCVATPGPVDARL